MARTNFDAKRSAALQAIHEAKVKAAEDERKAREKAEKEAKAAAAVEQKADEKARDAQVY